MRYDSKKFDKAVRYYKLALKGRIKKGNTVLVEMPLANEKAFFSIAPLSRAVHELGADMSVFVCGRGESKTLKVLEKIFSAFEELKKGAENKETMALQGFIETVNKKTKSKEFGKLFERPAVWAKAGKNGFSAEGFLAKYKPEWFKRFKWKQLLKTAKKIWVQGYGLKKSERVSIAFELMPKPKDLDLPLQDYLDSYAIAYAMATKAKQLAKEAFAGAGTNRMSQLKPMVKIDDLAATIVGCEYEKNIPEPWFKAFKKVSKEFKVNTLKTADVSFGVHGKGYGGKHFFGSKIGYPTPNMQSRWQAPGQMFLKPWWYTQTKLDNRPAKRRHAITETLPIENFIATCNIDYFAMRKRDEKIRDTMKKCVKLFVRGKPVKGGQTNLTLDLRHTHDGKSPILTSDIEVNPITPGEAAHIFKVKAGRYGNFPGGEVFLTPHKMDGVFVGDVVIAIDQSYIIGEKNPLVVSVKNGSYKIISGPKKILQAFKCRKKEAWKMILELEKTGAMPKSEIASYKRNFKRVGEFAVNTNPKARLSRYLIETEKLARMIHIALGSGYEPGRETTYHCDIVINNPRQKTNIFGIDEKGREHWIIKKGKFVV